MKKLILKFTVTILAVCPVVAIAQAPKTGVFVTDEEVKAVLKHAADTNRTIPDNTLRVVDMGKYQLGLAVIHRGAMGGAPNTPASAPAAPPTPCGQQSPNAKGPGGISHDDTAETYVVTSGAATIITGGTIVNGRRSKPDDEVTTILNGPSCSGTMVGYATRQIKVGDIVVIPEGVPHGFSAIPDHITYLSIRPDIKKVLQHGYVNPALKQ